MTATMLSDVVKIRGRFHRSVQLTRDWNEQRGLEEYLLTPTAKDLAAQIITGATSAERPKAWSITGPYGSGKSAFALFLTDLFANNPPEHPEAQSLRDEVKFSDRAFVPVLLVGQRAPLLPELLKSLAESIEQIEPKLGKKISAAAYDSHVTERKAVEYFEQSAQIAKESGYHGLLLIIDEFGKFLEYAAQNPETEDMLLLQDLAETAARSDVPIVFLTVLHSAFAEYVSVLDEARRMEWRKVQGRFTDLAFLEPPEQFLRLVGAAIEWQDFESGASKHQCIVEEILSSPSLEETKLRFPLSELLPKTIPLHPLTTLLLWPLFRSKLAQNERSLFAFLVDAGPYGFQEFLSLNSLAKETTEFYRVSQLYDYVTTTLGPTVFIGDRSRRWASIGNACDRVSTAAPPLARDIVKAIGLINIYGAPVGLQASEDVLKLALGENDAVSDAINYLQRASIIVYRRYERAFALWEGSDVDLDRCYEEALRHAGTGKLASRLKRIVNLRPVVAKAHYIRRGTLRYFVVDVIDGSESSLKKAFRKDVSPADGQIIFVITSDKTRRKNLIELAKELTSRGISQQKLHLFAFPDPIAGLEKALQEVEAWTWINENVTTLQGDPVAKQEVHTRVLYARGRLKDTAGSVLGLLGYLFEPQKSVWIQGGERQSLETATQFQKWLSQLCDAVYEKAPTLHNELLNRENISSAASAARRLLIEAMVVNEDQPTLSITGTPAEFSMYRALLETGGFHRQIEEKWQFTEPREEWLPVWEMMSAFLTSTETGRRPVTELIETLKAPPFGFRDGPIPVIVASLLLKYRDELALYEDGLFVPELRIEVFERLTKVPEIFEVQRYALSDSAKKAFTALSDILNSLHLSKLDEQADIIEIVRPLVVFVARLSEYSKRTKRVEPKEAIAVRETLLQARDPYKLIFNDLPYSVGVSLEEGESISEFAQKLKACLASLQGSYHRLLDDIEQQFRQVFGLYGKSKEVRQQLQTRAAPLDGFAAERTLSLFIREAGHVDQRDWREVLGRVVSKGVPPTHWHDSDFVNFQIRLQQLASDFIKLEELVAEKKRSGATQVIRIGLLDGQVKETRAVIAIPSDQTGLVDELAAKLIRILSMETDNGNNKEESRRIRIAALAKVAEKYLELDGEANNE